MQQPHFAGLSSALGSAFFFPLEPFNKPPQPTMCKTPGFWRCPHSHRHHMFFRPTCRICNDTNFFVAALGGFSYSTCTEHHRALWKFFAEVARATGQSRIDGHGERYLTARTTALMGSWRRSHNQTKQTHGLAPPGVDSFFWQTKP